MTREEIENKIREIHGTDEEQLEFILSDNKRIQVTASAGCGKTKTMISKIAYELITTPNLNHKKILALTFSVNASTKIKEDTASILPQIIGDEDFDVENKLDVSNYHGFSTKLLFKHGYIFHENLKSVEGFTIVPETAAVVNRHLIAQDVRMLTEFTEALKAVDKAKVDELIEDYRKLLIEKLIPNNVITYNGLLILGSELLSNPHIKNFYTKYYPMVIVDEFQDTNYLAYKIICNLIGDNKMILMGDDIQKIYGFLGAIPNLFEDMKTEFDMMPMEFKTNYRFQDNPKMLQLDNYIREIFKQYDDMDSFEETAEINFGFYTSERGEVDKIYSGLIEKTQGDNTAAVLVNINRSSTWIIDKLEENNITYFNGLFKDTDVDYQKFHKIAFDKFVRESGIGRSVSSRVMNSVIAEMEAEQIAIVTDIIVFNSLMRLLKALFEKTKSSSLSRAEKYDKISFTLSNGSLKRLMNEIDEKIVITTIHGSKGLEWDYIFIPQITSGAFPIYISGGSLCKTCKDDSSGTQYQKRCEFTFPSYLKSGFEEQLSLFYVAITRARKDVYMFANTENNPWGYPKKRSCFTALPNLTRNKDF
ncbi:ATP-dependent helicase [Vallitaleaceae bacterium 9-2]